LRVRPALLDHAFAFAPASKLTLDELLASNVRLHGMEIFPTYKSIWRLGPMESSTPSFAHRN